MARRNEAEVILTARDRTKSAFASINKSFGRFAGAAGVAGAVFALQSLTRQGLATIDNLAKVSQKLGIATEDLAALRLAAEKTGVSTKQLDLGIQRATRRIAEAAAGTGEAKKALEELGLSAQELSALTPDEQFRELAKAFEQVEGQANRVRLGFKLFDAEGVALINTLEGGAEALDAAAEAADKYGLSISAVEADSVESANDAITDAKAAVQGLSQSLAFRFAPAIEGSAVALSNFVAFVGNEVLPAFSFLAERIGLVTANVRALSEQEVLVRIELQNERIIEGTRNIERLREEVEETRAQAERLRNAGPNSSEAAGLAAFTAQENLKAAEINLVAAEERLEQLQAELDRRREITLEAERQLAEEQAALRLQFQLELQEQEEEAEREAGERRLDAILEREDRRREALFERGREERRLRFQEARELQRDLERQGRLEERAAERTIQLRQFAAAQGIKALQTLFAGNKRVSKALFVIEKGLAIGRTIVNTQAAAIKALAELGPIAGPPAAAAIQAAGAASVATIAATTIAGLAGGGGGSGGDFGSIPAAAQSAGGGGLGDEGFGGGGEALTEQGVVQLIFPNLFGITEEAIDALADALREASENRDVIVVSGQGRNSELLAGANG